MLLHGAECSSQGEALWIFTIITIVKPVWIFIIIIMIIIMFGSSAVIEDVWVEVSTVKTQEAWAVSHSMMICYGPCPLFQD